MTLQLYGRDPSYCIPNYSIVGNLLFDIVAQTPNRELSCFEKLYVITSVGLTVHPGYLADLYMACGCFSHARQLFGKPEHPRKLGDICWCEGELDLAEAYYSTASSEAQSYRKTADFDRLIKLAFFREQWSLVISRFASASFEPFDSPKQVILGNSVTSAQPYLDMLAVAICQTGIQTPTEALDILHSAFDLDERDWDKFLANPAFADPKTIPKLKARCRPRLGAQEALSVEEAKNKGDSVRARHVLAYIQAADEKLETAQRLVERFGANGSDADLQEFVQLVTGSGITSVSHSFLFAALGHDSFASREDLSSNILVRLFSSHPVMYKRHFGKALDIRFRNRLPVTADDLLTGMFQMLAAAARTEGTPDQAEFGIPRLASCREWARIRLEDWFQRRGKHRVEEVAATWRDGEAQPTEHPFYSGVIGPPETPRNMVEWNALLMDALKWLQRMWHREIGTSRWIVENQLYQIVRRLLKGMEVVQHARPLWLEPQHLDVYVPAAGIAIEYMGQQHFEPLEFFGGETAFQLVVERDRRKANLCETHAVELIRVRYDEDVGNRARQIAEQIKAKRAMQTKTA